MKILDIYPEDGQFQRIYCSKCGKYMILFYTIFDEEIDNISMRIEGLPILECKYCGNTNLPDKSRAAIIYLHEECIKKNEKKVFTSRRKPNEKFDFTEVDFNYDSDDYYYLPGLTRDHDKGFLTPVFFNASALIKFDNSPEYRIQFGSKTYGDIRKEDDYSIPFGINDNGKLVMWLGDIARLPIKEQYYLLSENVESDHNIGSEFYDGQIECIFTELSPENELIKCRSDFHEYALNKFGVRLTHLDSETLDMIEELKPPIVISPKENRNIYDILNKINIESINPAILTELLSQKGIESKKLGSLKKLQKLFEKEFPNSNISDLLSPLFVLYDLRIAYSHLTSEEKKETIIKSVCERLGLDSNENRYNIIYDSLIDQLIKCYKSLMNLD